jgi:hypothetical protein
MEQVCTSKNPDHALSNPEEHQHDDHITGLSRRQLDIHSKTGVPHWARRLMLSHLCRNLCKRLHAAQVVLGMSTVGISSNSLSVYLPGRKCRDVPLQITLPCLDRAYLVRCLILRPVTETEIFFICGRSIKVKHLLPLSSFFRRCKAKTSADK